ncbi:MAG: hypothetical protein AAF960_04665 [Bacteroidota bacterium]
MLNIKIKHLTKHFFIGFFALIATTGIAQETAQKSIFDVLHYQEVLPITIGADFAALDTTRREEKKHPAKLTFEDETGDVQDWNIKLEVRGNFRRLKCEMPPLKIHFKKKDLKAAGLAKFDDLKLVTHCVSSKSEAKALLQKEYLAYRLYNEMTYISFRVQLFKVTYVDSKTGKKTKHWAFAIEDTAELEHRIGATAKVENHLNLPRDTFHDGMLKIVSLYQYMIGNADWDISVGRNVKYFIKKGKVLPVPYDFDFSGLVNAPYAIANPNYGISKVTDRIFIGFKEDATQLKSTLAFFKTKRLALLETIDDFKVIDEAKREVAINYINSFYATMDKIVVGERVTKEAPEEEVVSLK